MTPTNEELSAQVQAMHFAICALMRSVPPTAASIAREELMDIHARAKEHDQRARHTPALIEGRDTQVTGYLQLLWEASQRDAPPPAGRPAD